jgi:flagellar hook-basal body complex protein FliE
MAAPISSISSSVAASPIRLPSLESGSKGPGTFQDVLAGAIQNVESFGRDASASVERTLSGEGEELHNTIIATQRAELSFELFLQMRNKVVSAYQEIMRMPM